MWLQLLSSTLVCGEPNNNPLRVVARRNSLDADHEQAWMWLRLKKRAEDD